MHGAGDDDQPAGLLGHEAIEQFDLQFVQLQPVEVEGHDAVVLKQFVGQFREIEQHVVRFLRHAGRAGLEQHVERHVAVAKQLVTQEPELAHRATGQQQHLGFALDDGHACRLEVVTRFHVVVRRDELSESIATSPLRSA